DGAWQDHSWSEIGERVDRFRSALAVEGLSPGDRVGILVANGIDWVCLDLAAHAAGLVVVGLYPHDTAGSNAFILGHSEARLLLVDSVERWQSLVEFRSEFPALEYAWVSEAISASPDDGIALRSLSDILASSSEPPAAHPAKADDLATLIYTSGTSGRPKGVMLSHHAVLWNAHAAAAIIPPRRDDVFLSILPLAHAFERTAGYYLPVIGGSTVAYARSPQTMREDLAAVKPTVVLAVPRLYERMYAAIRSAARDPIKSTMLHLTVSAGWRRFEVSQRRGRLGVINELLWPLLKRGVADKVLAAFGGRLRVAVSGGAPLDRGVARLLIGLGLPLVEGYGLTEAAPTVSANRLDDNFPGSVGRPLEGVEVKLAADNELMVRTPSIMAGYWRDPGQTARAIDPEGWLSTGDQVEIVDGRLFVRGRTKEMIVLSIGENVNPNVVEAELTRDTLFEQAVVVGHGRPFLCTVIVLDQAAWSRFAAEHNLDARKVNSEPCKAAVLTRIERQLRELPRFAQVRAVHLTLDPWTIDNGMLTPTLKIKRERVADRFAGDIERIYSARLRRWAESEPAPRAPDRD
ncbi:MAG: long-chain fatty acid--CoA ligase, partial [Bauldia sp.]